MSLVKSLSAVVVLGAAASAASAGITPRWVDVTPASYPAGVPAGARSFSLVVDLSGASLFNVAGLRLDQTDLPGVTFYNDGFGSDTTPNPAFLPVFPSLAFDTYVGTTAGFAQAPSVPGRYEGAGGAIVGQNGEVNVAWGATPSTGPAGGQGLEIARLTLVGPLVAGETPVRGEVRASDATGVAVPLPPLPVAIPEPATLGLAAIGLGLVSLRRR